MAWKPETQLDYRKINSKVERVLSKKGVPPEDLEDAVQAGWVRLWKSDCQPRSWVNVLVKVAFRAWLESRRGGWAKYTVVSWEDLLEEGYREQADRDEQARLEAKVDAAVLGAKESEVKDLLRYYSESPLPSTERVRARRALAKLGKKLKIQCNGNGR